MYFHCVYRRGLIKELHLISQAFQLLVPNTLPVGFVLFSLTTSHFCMDAWLLSSLCSGVLAHSFDSGTLTYLTTKFSSRSLNYHLCFLNVFPPFSYNFIQYKNIKFIEALQIHRDIITGSVICPNCYLVSFLITSSRPQLIFRPVLFFP